MSEMENHISQEPSSKANIFIRLFRGDVSLPITYWVFGVGTNIILRLVNFFLEKNSSQIIMYEYGQIGIHIYFWFTNLINIFMFIAIWRSARKYEQSPGWAGAAKIIVLLAAIALTFNLYSIYFSESDESLQSEIEFSNKSLPIMIDDETRLDKMALKDRNIYYYYSMMQNDKSEMDINYFSVMLRKNLIEHACKDKVIQKLMKQNRKVIYDYKDKNNNFVTDVVLEASDCE
jgi:hypothetical protein